MRWVHFAVIILLAIAILVFAAQNFQITTTSFLGFSVRVPLALLIPVVYLLGMVTGSSLLALIRWSMHGYWRQT